MFIMFILLSALCLLTMRVSSSEDLIIFDNFEYGELVYGPEDKMVDYALLALDKKTNLPPSFTICSSVHLNFMISSVFFYQLYQDDGKPWFNLMMRSLISGWVWTLCKWKLSRPLRAARTCYLDNNSGLPLDLLCCPSSLQNSDLLRIFLSIFST